MDRKSLLQFPWNFSTAVLETSGLGAKKSSQKCVQNLERNMAAHED